jgi:ubiquitin-conjugating enzyme E2 J1
MSARSPTVRRILREAAELSQNPAPDYTASPLDSDLFDWHFTFRGPPNSAYAQGIYHGRIVLPHLYPLRPPSFRFLTASGRFEVNREICLSISGHHEETWQPAWGVRTALVALRSFMETDAQGQLGGMEMPRASRESIALESRSYRCPTCARTNLEIIQACEERSKEAVDSAQSVDIPAELRMAWRDEMSAPGPNNTSSDSQSQPQRESRQETPDSEVAELAEGFVATTLTPPTNVNLSSGPSNMQPTTTAPAQSAQIQAQDRRPVQVRPNNGVPVWVDRAIVVLVVALLAMILKLVVGK